MSEKHRTTDSEELTLRDNLAIDRTALANERNFLAFVRTSIAFVAGGFGLIKFTDEIGLIIIGWILVSLGVVILLVGILRFIKFYRSIQKLGGQIYSLPRAFNKRFE